MAPRSGRTRRRRTRGRRRRARGRRPRWALQGGAVEDRRRCSWQLRGSCVPMTSPRLESRSSCSPTHAASIGRLAVIASRSPRSTPSSPWTSSHAAATGRSTPEASTVPSMKAVVRWRPTNRDSSSVSSRSESPLLGEANGDAQSQQQEHGGKHDDCAARDGDDNRDQRAAWGRGPVDGQALRGARAGTASGARAPAPRRPRARHDHGGGQVGRDRDRQRADDGRGRVEPARQRLRRRLAAGSAPRSDTPSRPKPRSTVCLRVWGRAGWELAGGAS